MSEMTPAEAVASAVDCAVPFAVWVVRQGDEWPMRVESIWVTAHEAAFRAQSLNSSVGEPEWQPMRYTHAVSAGDDEAQALPGSGGQDEEGSRPKDARGDVPGALQRAGDVPAVQTEAGSQTTAPVLGDEAQAVAMESQRQLLQRLVCEDAIASSPMFSVEHWKHHAGEDWPHEPDDDSYLFFENCQHPDCKLARSAGGSGPSLEAWHRPFHELWTHAVGTPGYDKEKWLSLEAAYHTMRRALRQADPPSQETPA